MITFETIVFQMDCDYDPQTSKKTDTGKKKRNRYDKKDKNKEEKELGVEKNDEKYEKYTDELYQLDYEDMIGDLPCRFKYRQVVPNSFGLTIEEVIIAILTNHSINSNQSNYIIIS